MRVIVLVCQAISTLTVQISRIADTTCFGGGNDVFVVCCTIASMKLLTSDQIGQSACKVQLNTCELA